MQTAPSLPINPQLPAPWLLLRVWLMIGLQSFGGGAATLALLRRAVVDERHWLTDDEFTQEWAICQVTPGINLLAITILIGKRLAGAPGIAIALFGLLFPSVTITIIISAFFAQVHRLPAGQAVLRGIVPATVGLGLLTAYQIARPPIVASLCQGTPSLMLNIGILAGSGLAIAIWHLPVVQILIGAGLISAFSRWLQSRTSNAEEVTPLP